MSSQPVDFRPCGPLGAGQCFFSNELGPLICNDTGGIVVQPPIDRCPYYLCGYENIEIRGNMTDGPLTEGAEVCVHGTYSGATSFKTRPLGLWSILLVALTFIPTVVHALPTTGTGFSSIENHHSLARRNVTTSSFERNANVDWTSVESQLSGKSAGSSTIIGRSKFTLLGHEANPAPDSIGKNILAARQLEGIPAYDTVYQENVDRTGSWDECPQVQSPCIRSGLSEAGGGLTVEIRYERSAEISFGLSASAVKTIADLITENFGLSLGFVWKEVSSYSQADTCFVNQDVGVAQMFWQLKMGWADTATRTCQVSPIYGELYCTDWVFGHADYPLESSNGIPAREIGCSAGEENVHCNDTIGTLKC